MKVAVYEGIKSIRLEERPDPKAAPGEVIVRVKYCGICGTDVHAYWYEPLDAPGHVFGHEIVGTIAEVGKGVEGWQVGDRVLVDRGGGGMAEYMEIQDTQRVFKLPDEVSFEEAVLWDPICVPLRGIRQSRFRIGDNVVVAGAGAIGLSAVQLLRMGGARHITVLEPIAKKREFALKCGADVGLNPIAEGDALQEKVRALYGGAGADAGPNPPAQGAARRERAMGFFGSAGADVAYECAGSSQSFQALLGLVKRGGQVLLVGVTNKETPVVESALIRGEIEIKGSLTFRDEDIRICLDFLAKRRFNTKGMISDIISLDDVVKGMERLISPDEGLIKVVVAP
jgi:threonine dehydrogenase-like Zn-dependent dehydrogenase